MPRLVSLSRAAKLVGISRGALQKKVHDNELISFEGQVNLDDIERIFPEAQIEDNHIIEDLEKIVEQALTKARGAKLAKLLAPDTYTLAARLQAINLEHAQSRKLSSDLLGLIAEIKSRVTELSATSSKPYLFSELVSWIDDSVTNFQADKTLPSSISDKDTVLRVIASQVHIKNTSHEYFIEGNNTILEAGLSAGLALNYGCSNGNCGKCKAKLISGKILKTRPHDFVFTESEKLQNYFLCCSNTATTDIVIEADEADSEKDIPQQEIDARVKKVDVLSDAVSILNLKTPRTKRLRFLAGQSVLLSYANLPAVNIPIASCPCDDMNIQFHIPQQENNDLVKYIHQGLKTSDLIHIDGPYGSFILDEDSDKSILFIAFDTGFAPVKSLIEHAITLEHAEFIDLLWLHSDNKPYMHNQCRAWEDALDNFNYQHSQIDINESKKLTEKLQLLAKNYSDLNQKNIYICGAEDVVRKTREILLDHGAEEEQIKVQAV